MILTQSAVVQNVFVPSILNPCCFAKWLLLGDDGLGENMNDWDPSALAVKLSLPDWVGPFLKQRDLVCSDVDSRMRLAIDRARAKMEHGTGGPFGAAVFERESGKLVAVGINLVVPSAQSWAHAEMVALSLAQLRLGTFDLGADGLPASGASWIAGS